MKPIFLQGGAEYKSVPPEVLAILQEIVAINKMIVNALAIVPVIQIPGHWPASARAAMSKEWEAAHASNHP